MFFGKRTCARDTALSLLVFSVVSAASNSVVLPLKSSAYGLWYTAEVEFGNQTLSVLTDTGSSDLWVLGPNWICAPKGVPMSRSNCPSNDSYVQSSTFKPVEDAYLGELYGQGIIIGPLGYEDIKLGSLAISQQEMAFVNSTTAGVDSSVSGLMGLAFPVLDQAHPASYPVSDILVNITKANAPGRLLSNRISYPTVQTRLQEMGVTNFSFAIERTAFDEEIGFGGYLAFGRLPPVSHGDFVTVPVELLQDLPSIYKNGTSQIMDYWTLTVGAVSWGNQRSTTPFQAVVDSGNGINYVPKDIADKFNAAFDPPGKFDPGTFWYQVNCNATTPTSLGLEIGGHMFDIDTKDMIFKTAGGSCFSSLGASPKAFGTEIPILGDTFLKNVVAVFDWSKKEMQFAPRQTNLSTSGPNPSSSTGGAAVSPGSRSVFSVLLAVVMVAIMI